MIDVLSNLVGPGTLKAGLKAIDKIVPGSTTDMVNSLNHFQGNPSFLKYRCEQLQDYWDDHEDDVEEFFDNVGDAIAEGWNTVTENTAEVVDSIGDAISDNAGDVLEAVGTFFGSMFGG